MISCISCVHFAILQSSPAVDFTSGPKNCQGMCQRKIPFLKKKFAPFSRSLRGVAMDHFFKGLRSEPSFSFKWPYPNFHAGFASA